MKLLKVQEVPCLTLPKVYLIKKNSVAVDFSKHSGQTIKLCIPFERFESFCNIIKKCQKPTDDKTKEEQIKKHIEVISKELYDHLYPKESRTIKMLCKNEAVEEKYKKIKCFKSMMRFGKFLSEEGKESV